MDEALEAKASWEKSAEAWIAYAAQTGTNRTHVLDPAMLDCLGDVRGLRVADIGCGEGRFSRILAERGALVTGLDLTPALVAEACRLDPNSRYLIGDAEKLPFADGEFDASVSYLVLIDVPDFRAAIREMARVTRPGGRIVVTSISSFASTAPAGWHRDERGTKLHFPVDRYFDEVPLRVEWSDISVLNWHRPLEAYMSAYLDADLILERFIEPKPKPEVVAAIPTLIDLTRIAFFNVMSWRRPT